MGPISRGRTVISASLIRCVITVFGPRRHQRHPGFAAVNCLAPRGFEGVCPTCFPLVAGKGGGQR
jgi:hypothetical protein